MIYEVLIVPAAKLRILEQAKYIAVEMQAPEAAAKWLARVFDRVDGVAEMPRRYAIALEDGWCDYEVRRALVGQFALFFTVVEETRTVWVIHAKHGRQLTQRDDFPADLASLEEDDE